jgi:hypothetical protein
MERAGNPPARAFIDIGMPWTVRGGERRSADVSWIFDLVSFD